MKRTFDNELERYRILIYGIQANSSIMERIAPVYPDDRLAAGAMLYQAAKTAAEAQGIEKLESLEATKAFNQSRDRIHQTLSKLRQAARYFFKNDFRILKLLQIDQEVPAAYAAWKAMAELSFKAAQSEAAVLAKLAISGISSEILDQMLIQINELEQLRLNAEREDGQAQQATQQKTEAFNQLKAYCIDLRECLDLFYEGAERQKLEEVGILVK